MTSYKVLVAQRDALDRQILETRAREIRAAISRMRSLVMEHGIKPDDIFGKKAQQAQKLELKSTPKYRDPASGATWAGRGKPPQWIQNKNREDFLIQFWETSTSALPKSQVVSEYFEDETRAGV
ncbi:H-NS family nucleoid-associated regulatory protein [Pseudorhodoferax soli]|uniref:DNA-binding protein H-NS n=1 Tax=Pseudorhodoferax soli TaxID=545864 RepID=A0A368XHW6_9BURK|nr:DNA-binding protein H-NS [Pseudorhodoferax soli]